MSNHPSLHCIAAFLVVTFSASCVTQPTQWAAHGYLTPRPTSEPEVIGVFNDLDKCENAADGWASRQVVGNPVFAECYPVDQH